MHPPRPNRPHDQVAPPTMPLDQLLLHKSYAYDIFASPASRMECNRVPSEFLSARRTYGRSHARREASGTFVSKNLF